MRWLLRDLGIFLYGCLFAGKYSCAGYFSSIRVAQGARVVAAMRSPTFKPTPTPLKRARALL
jgi:hypothetical protein